MNDFCYSYSSSSLSFSPNSKETLSKLEELEAYCKVYYCIGQCPVLFFIWNRDWKSLKMYFGLELEKSHTSQVTNVYLYWCELLLSSAFQLRIFLLQNKDWVQDMIQYSNSERREIMKYVIINITDFIDDFVTITKSNDTFWRHLFDGSRKEYPFVSMYSKIALK